MAKRKRVNDLMLLVAGEQVQSETSTYVINGVAGRGGFGAVYSASVPEMPGRHAALKEFFTPSHPRDQAALKEIYEREKYVGAQASAHPLMPTYYEAFKADGCIYIAQEFIEGTTLDEIIINRHPLPREWILKWAVSLCDALAFLHTRQIVHHDLKPANIRITPTGHLVLLDFGAAQYFGKGTEKPAELYGTEGYLPPELDSDGQWVADVRTDIFALGCILYEMIAGEPPDQKQINQRSVYVTNTLMQRPNADLNLVSLINKALSFNTEYRYQGAQEFLAEIRKSAPPVLLLDQKRLRFGNVTTGQMVAPLKLSPFNAGGGNLRLEVKPRSPWLAVSKANTDPTNHEILVHVDVAEIEEFNKVVTGKLEINSPDELDEAGKVVTQGDRWFVECSVNLIPRHGNVVLLEQMSPNSSPIFITGKSGSPGAGKFSLKNVAGSPIDVSIICDLSTAPPFVSDKLRTLVISPETATLGPGQVVEVTLDIPKTELAIGEYRNMLVVKTSENQAVPVPFNVQISGRSQPVTKRGILGASSTGITINGPEEPKKALAAANVNMQELSKLEAPVQEAEADSENVAPDLFPVMQSEPNLEKGTVFKGILFDPDEPAVPKVKKKVHPAIFAVLGFCILGGGAYFWNELKSASGAQDATIDRPAPPKLTAVDRYLQRMRVLKGGPFGSDGSKGNEYAKAFDGDTKTYFDSTQATGGFVTLIIDKPARVYAIRFFPRTGFEYRMYGGSFVGSNTMGYGYTTLLYINQTPSPGWNIAKVQNTGRYKFLEYVGPDNGNCNVAEIEYLTKK